MHLLLATSLQDLLTPNRPGQNGDVLARNHFHIGGELLRTAIAREKEPDHMSVMTAFWLLYMHGSNEIDVDARECLKLSEAVRDYVQKHQLDSLCSDFPITAQTNLSRRDKSLIARLLVWIFYADVGFCFRHRGGAFARYLCESAERSFKIYETSRIVLELNWGDEYPVDQVIDDVQNSDVLEMLYRVSAVCQGVNDYHIDNSGRHDIEKELICIEEKYASIFRLATTNTMVEPWPRLLTNAEFIVSYFYAVRIYHFCSSIPDAKDKEERPLAVSQALAAILDIAQRTFATGNEELYERMQWPLFVAGLETADAIHKEWILEKLTIGTFKEILREIARIQEKSGKRSGMAKVRELCGSEKRGSRRGTFLGF